MSALKSRIKKLESQSNSGVRLVYVPVGQDMNVWKAAEEIINSGRDPEAINLREILKEINGTGLGLPSPAELKEFSRDERGFSFSLVSVHSGESFPDAVDRLKRLNETPIVHS